MPCSNLKFNIKKINKNSGLTILIDIFDFHESKFEQTLICQNISADGRDEGNSIF